MKTILIFGASAVHGVGGARGGWADKLKLALHAEMFGNGSAAAQSFDVYELGVPGNTMADLTERFLAEATPRIKRRRPEDVIVIFSAGTNDSRAVDVADNHVSTPDDFAAAVHSFIHLAKDYAAHILAVGLWLVDQAKTMPDRNESDPGKLTYISNDRIKSFDEALQRTCEEEGISFVSLFENLPPDWQQSYLFSDGLHPADRGHEWIFTQVEPVLRELIGQNG